MSVKTGSQAERYARDYLIAQGLRWITSNYRCRMGEIDLIMRDSEDLVFVEVRHRSSAAFGGALSSITYGKKQKLIKAASHYLVVHHLYDRHPMRFDVISLDGMRPTIQWIKNAFSIDH